MSPNKPFDLCERTFLFARDIVSFCLVLSQRPGAHRQIAGQLLRAGTSVGANQEEAKGAYSREARESRFWLRLIAARNLSSDDRLGALLTESNELVDIYITTVRTAKQTVERQKREQRARRRRNGNDNPAR